MDELLKQLSALSVQLLPILGVVVLIFLVLILYRFLKIAKQLSGTVVKVDSTIQTVEDRLNDLKGPLQTINRISGSVDLVQDAAEKAVKKMVVAVSSNYDLIKDWVSTFFDKRKQNKQGFDEPLE
jgi:predicted PurR-regulated permease PerM